MTITRHLRVFNARQFKDALGESDNPTEHTHGIDRAYLFIGRTQDWSNSQNVPVVNTNVNSIDYDFWKYMIAAKKIDLSDVTHALKRYNWIANTVYRQFDSTDPNLYDEPISANTFYVLTSDDNVYKCLFNNKGTPANDEPTGTTTTVIETNDGYKWKFMYTISGAEANKFKTTDHIPVKTLEEDDSSAQWSVQQAATNGAIDVVFVANSGNGYIEDRGNPEGANSTSITLSANASSTTDIFVGSTVFISSGLGVGQLREIIDYAGTTRTATINTEWTTTPNTTSTYHVAPKIDIKGSGTGAQAYANVASNTGVEKVNMISTGQNYSYANVTVSANSGAGARAYPSLSPPGGHGSDAVSELAGHNVMISVQLTGSESNTITTNNDFRQVGIIANPLEKDGSAANNTIYDQTVRLTLENIIGSFIEDERIVGDNTATVGFMVNFANTNGDGSEGVLSVTNVSNGSFIEETITSNSGVTATVNSVASGDLSRSFGELLYILNRSKIERDENQTEDFRLVVTF